MSTTKATDSPRRANDPVVITPMSVSNLLVASDADPAADWPSALTVLGATAIIAGPYEGSEDSLVSADGRTVTSKTSLIAVGSPPVVPEFSSEEHTNELQSPF